MRISRSTARADADDADRQKSLVCVPRDESNTLKGSSGSKKAP